MSRKDVLFSTKEILDILQPLKEQFKNRIEENKNFPWYDSVMRFEWERTKMAGGSIMVNILFKGSTLNVRFTDEVHSGMIMPFTEEEASELAQKLTNFRGAIEKRDKEVTINIRKYKVEPETEEEDRLKIKKDENGNPILPPDGQISQFYQLNKLLDEIFKIEIRRQKAARMLIQEDDVNDDDPAKAILFSNSKVVNRVQEKISSKSKNSANNPLPNPITRLTLPHKKEETMYKIFDKTKQFINSRTGKKDFEAAKYEGKPINAFNIHKFLTSGSLVSGIAWFYVAISNLGISIPCRVKTILVERHEFGQKEYDVSDIFDVDSLIPSLEEKMTLQTKSKDDEGVVEETPKKGKTPKKEENARRDEAPKKGKSPRKEEEPRRDETDEDDANDDDLNYDDLVDALDD